MHAYTYTPSSNNFTTASILLAWVYVFINHWIWVCVWHETIVNNIMSLSLLRSCVLYTVLHTELVTVTYLQSCLKSYSLLPDQIYYRVVHVHCVFSSPLCRFFMLIISSIHYVFTEWPLCSSHQLCILLSNSFAKM